MPKRLILLFSTLLGLSAGLPLHAGFSLSGRLPSLEPGTALSLKQEDLDRRQNEEVAQIATDDDNRFHETLDLSPGLYTLSLPNQRELAIAAEAGQQIELVPDGSAPANLRVDGSPSTTELRAYERFRKASLERLVYPPRQALRRAQSTNAPEPERSELAQAEVAAYDAHRRELNDYVIDHVSFPSALYATSLRWDGDYRFEELKQTFTSAAKRADSSLSIMQSMRQRLNDFSKTAIGASAGPLQGSSPAGEPLALSDYLGGYVLVDFWASWCAPCRVENRNYSKLLNSYSNRGFTIFGVSLDTSRDRWKQASERDAVTWPQISDLQGWNSPLARAYNVTALPMNFLLDPEGRIIARNLRGDELADKLEELFGPANAPL